MSAVPMPHTLAAQAEGVFYPSSDGEPLAETDFHLRLSFMLIGTLWQIYKNRPDCYVTGNVFLYYEEGNPEARRAPDVMVVKGVAPDPPRASFKIWEEKAIPCVIFEITSPKTADEDRGAKFQLYEQLGVKEYFLFDPRHEYLERPLMGYRLINRRYEPLIPSADGCLVSNELQIQLCPEQEKLALIDFKTGKRLLPPLERVEEAERSVQEANRRAAEADRRAAEADRRLSVQQQRAAEAVQSAAEAKRQQSILEQRAAEAVQRAAEVEKQRLLEQRRAEEATRRVEQAERRAAELAAELARLRAAAPPSDEGKPSA